MKGWVPRQRSAGKNELAGLLTPTRRGRRALRREAREIVASMPVPVPFDLDTLVANISAARQRRIVLMPIPDQLLGDTGLCGLWIKHRTEPLDLILHMNTPSSFHRQRIVLHELVHLWADDADGVTGGQMADLLAGLPSEMVERLVGGDQVSARHRYETRRELRTEIAAAYIDEQACAMFIEDPTVRRLAEDFTHPFGGSSHI